MPPKSMPSRFQTERLKSFGKPAVHRSKQNALFVPFVCPDRARAAPRSLRHAAPRTLPAAEQLQMHARNTLALSPRRPRIELVYAVIGVNASARLAAPRGVPLNGMRITIFLLDDPRTWPRGVLSCVSKAYPPGAPSRIFDCLQKRETSAAHCRSRHAPSDRANSCRQVCRL
jgi:hypothetical protein